MTVAYPGIRDQTHLDDLVHFDGTVTTGGTAQLLLPQQPGRLFLAITNTAAGDGLFVGLGPARATATLASGQVSAIAVTNGGLGYTVPPQVVIMGGIVAGDYVTTPGSTKSGVPGQTYPGTLAQAHATLSSGAINAIVVDNPGSGYLVAPLIYLENPWPLLGGGAYSPTATGSTTGTGLLIPAGQTFTFNGALMVPGSAVAINGFTTGDSFSVVVGGLT
jgi:hypothetical protein